MNLRYLRVLPMLMLAAAVAACGVAQQTAAPAGAPTAEMMGEMMGEEAMAGAPTAEMMGEMMGEEAMAGAPTAEMMGEMMGEAAMAGAPTADAIMMMKPLWQTLEITDARTGESFTLGDFAGRPVYVEPMATWCHECREQLTNVRGAHEQLGGEAIFIALSVETNVSSVDLARYADEAGFGWTFAVITPELLGALTDTFGRSVTNPPATPHFVIRPDGSATELSTGVDSADEIVRMVRAAAGS